MMDEVDFVFIYMLGIGADMHPDDVNKCSAWEFAVDWWDFYQSNFKTV